MFDQKCQELQGYRQVLQLWQERETKGRFFFLFFFWGGGGAGQGGKGVPGPALTTDMDYGLWMNVDNVDLVLFFF